MNANAKELLKAGLILLAIVGVLWVFVPEANLDAGNAAPYQQQLR